MISGRSKSQSPVQGMLQDKHYRIVWFNLHNIIDPCLRRRLHLAGAALKKILGISKAPFQRNCEVQKIPNRLSPRKKSNHRRDSLYALELNQMLGISTAPLQRNCEVQKIPNRLSPRKKIQPPPGL